MKILVLAKQVPGSQQVAIDPETGVIKRPAKGNKTNPYDLVALETAVRLKEQAGGTVTVLAMGPEQAAQVLSEAFSLGADEGVLLTDRRLVGSDVLATSLALSQAIAATGSFDLIICGKQTTDGDTAQVPPSLARWLGLPMAAWAKNVEIIDSKALRLTQDFGDVIYQVRLDLPCVISVESDSVRPRLPSYKMKKQTAGKTIRRVTMDDFEIKDNSQYGLEGSPTKVEKIFPPGNTAICELWSEPPREAAGKLADKLEELKIL